MTDNDRIGFLWGCAIGWNLDSDDVEHILSRYGLTLDDSLMACQLKIREHMGEERWENGIRLIQARTRDPQFN